MQRSVQARLQAGCLGLVKPERVVAWLNTHAASSSWSRPAQVHHGRSELAPNQLDVLPLPAMTAAPLMRFTTPGELGSRNGTLRAILAKA